MGTILTWALAFWMFWLPQSMAPQHTGATAHAAGGNPTWTWIASSFNLSCVTNPCSPGSFTASSGDVFVVASDDYSNKSYTIAGVSSGGTWNLCPSQTCSVTQASIGKIDLSYNLASSAGTVTPSITLTGLPAGGWAAIGSQWRCTANCGTFTIDQLARTTTSASCSSCTAASFGSLSGAGDLEIQVVLGDNDIAAPSAPYASDASTGAYIYALGSSALTAPSVCQTSTPPTCTPVAGAFLATALAVKK